jgi:hypothetical protein
MVKIISKKHLIRGIANGKNSDRSTQQMYGIAACYRTATDTGMIRHSTTIK